MIRLEKKINNYSTVKSTVTGFQSIKISLSIKKTKSADTFANVKEFITSENDNVTTYKTNDQGQPEKG